MGGYHRIQLLFASGTFSDFGQVHFEITSTIAGEMLFFFHSFDHVCLLLVSPADCEVRASRRHLVRGCGRASLLERRGWAKVR